MFVSALPADTKGVVNVNVTKSEDTVATLIAEFADITTLSFGNKFRVSQSPPVPDPLVIATVPPMGIVVLTSAWNERRGLERVAEADERPAASNPSGFNNDAFFNVYTSGLL